MYLSLEKDGSRLHGKFIQTKRGNCFVVRYNALDAERTLEQLAERNNGVLHDLGTSVEDDKAQNGLDRAFDTGLRVFFLEQQTKQRNQPDKNGRR